MKRYLLFDSDCSKCSKIAQEVEQAGRGWLQARSLRESAMTSLLDRVQPGWTWRPMLLELNDDRAKVYTGTVMVFRLLIRLGPRKTLQLAKMLQAASPDHLPDPQRRRFLRQGAGGIAALALLLGMPRQRASASRNNQQVNNSQADGPQGPGGIPAGAEIYDGFLILPETASTPSFVQHGRGIDQHSKEIESLLFTDKQEFSDALSSPIYIPTYIPSDLRFSGGQIWRYKKSGDIHSVILTYDGFNSDLGLHDAQLTVFVHYYPSKPTLVRYGSSPFIADGKMIYPEKVSSTPSPGVKIPTVSGDLVHWFDDKTLYTVATRSVDTVAVVASLSKD